MFSPSKSRIRNLQSIGRSSENQISKKCAHYMILRDDLKHKEKKIIHWNIMKKELGSTRKRFPLFTYHIQLKT